eukprot:668276-Pleurochrysis_carterae.AAC.1
MRRKAAIGHEAGQKIRRACRQLDITCLLTSRILLRRASEKGAIVCGGEVSPGFAKCATSPDRRRSAPAIAVKVDAELAIGACAMHAKRIRLTHRGGLLQPLPCEVLI